MKKILIGLDVGNHDVKTQSTITPSGFSESLNASFSNSGCLHYGDYYYSLDPLSRFSYTMDKTINNKCFILSLFGIAKEIIYQITKKENNLSQNEIQKRIQEITTVNLGIGLPPTHCATLSEKNIRYYTDNFSSGIYFNFDGYNFALKLGCCKVFAQDFAAITAYALNKKLKNSIIQEFDTYYAIDIGGWTVDIVSMMNGQPSIRQCDSKPLGVLKMYDEIISYVEKDAGIRLTPVNIEDVLKGKATILDDEIKEMIKDKALKWFHLIIGELRQFGVDFDIYPAIFLGGGSLLFQDFIYQSKISKKYEILSNIHANADGYAKLLRLSMKKS